MPTLNFNFSQLCTDFECSPTHGVWWLVLSISWFSALILKTEVIHFPSRCFLALPFFQTLSRVAKWVQFPGTMDRGWSRIQPRVGCCSHHLLSLEPLALGPWHSSVTQLSTPTAFQACLEITDFILQWRFCHENKGIRNTLQFTLKWDYLQPWWGGYWVQLRLQCSWRTLDVKINSTKEMNSKGIQCSRMHFTNKILTSNQEKRHHNLKPIQV